MTDDDGNKYVTKESEGFELYESEDKSDEPVKARTEFKDLAKEYKGFSYSYAIQTDDGNSGMVRIYYTRNTVKYIFYDNSSEVFKVLATRSGTYGLSCEKPNVKINGKLVTQWKTNGGEPFEGIFKEEDMPFYPLQTKYAIGTKIKPTALGDIVFCDGSAASLAEVQAATGDTLASYKEKAVAVIVFTRYNAATGSATDGDKIIGVGIQALNSAAPESGERYKSLFKKIWRFNKRPNPYRVSYICQSYHGYYDLCDIQNLFGSFDKTANTDNSDSNDSTDNDSAGNDWTAIKTAMDYGNTLKNPKKGNMDLTDELTEGWYLPNWHELGLLMATNYKYNNTLYSACDALEITRPDPASDNFWVTASKVNTSDNNVYAAFINPANSFTTFNTLISDDTTYWKNVDEKCQILPFREFK